MPSYPATGARIPLLQEPEANSPHLLLTLSPWAHLESLINFISFSESSQRAAHLQSTDDGRI